MTNKVKIAIAIALISIIIILDIVLGKCTDQLIDETEESLSLLKQALIEEKKSEYKKKSKDLENKWKKSENKLSYFIEHDELEKVSSKIAIILENSQNQENELALEDIIETRYLLDHIKDKLKLKLKNVF